MKEIDNIKDLIESFIKTECIIEDVKANQSPHSKGRTNFVNFINNYENFLNLMEEMYERYGFTCDALHNSFADTVGSLLDSSSEAKSKDVIMWYLYERFDEQGNLLPLIDDDENEVFIDSPENLYQFLFVKK